MEEVGREPESSPQGKFRASHPGAHPVSTRALESRALVRP